MTHLPPETLAALRNQFPKGCRVKLIRMNDPYNHDLKPGAKGTVIAVDDLGTIFVAWDCGSSLGVAFGEDICARIDSEEGDQ